MRKQPRIQMFAGMLRGDIAVIIGRVTSPNFGKSESWKLLGSTSDRGVCVCICSREIFKIVYNASSSLIVDMLRIRY